MGQKYIFGSKGRAKKKTGQKKAGKIKASKNMFIIQFNMMPFGLIVCSGRRGGRILAGATVEHCGNMFMSSIFPFTQNTFRCLKPT